MKKLYDIKSIAREWGVKEEPFIDNGVFRAMEPKWDTENFNRLVDMVERETREPAEVGEYAVTNSHEPWITLALLDMFDDRGLRYIYPNAEGEALELHGCERGEREENFDARSEVFFEGEDIFVNFNSDRPDRDGPHTFDIRNVNSFVVPDLPDGKNIYIHAKGMFCAMINLAQTYIPGAKSVWLAAHEADYVCAHTKTDDFRLGDVRERTIRNEL